MGGLSGKTHTLPRHVCGMCEVEDEAQGSEKGGNGREGKDGKPVCFFLAILVFIFIFLRVAAAGESFWGVQGKGCKWRDGASRGSISAVSLGGATTELLGPLGRGHPQLYRNQLLTSSPFPSLLYVLLMGSIDSMMITKVPTVADWISSIARLAR